MNQDKESWPPKPSELEQPSLTNKRTTVSPIPLGIMSSVLSALLLGGHLFFFWHLHQRSFQERFNFLIMHRALYGLLQGADIVGIPVAFLLGLLSWRTKVGQVGLSISVIFLLAALYIFLFGLPLPRSFIVGLGR